MTKFLQTLVDGVAVGSLYGLIALGYTMVYGILQFINFAHSDVFTIGAWASYAIAVKLGWVTAPDTLVGQILQPLAVITAAMMICGLLGFTIERGAYRPLRFAPRLNVLITAIGVSLLLQNVGQLQAIFGTSPQRMPSLLPTRELFTVAGVKILLVDVFVIVLAQILMASLEWLVHRTKFGMAMRAVSFDTRTASLMGINVDRVISLTFIIGSALAAAAGFLYAQKYPGLNQPASANWVLLGLKAFIAAVVGGIGNIRGAMVGGLIIGLLEMFGKAYHPLAIFGLNYQSQPQLADVYVFLLLIVMLLVKPSGLLGKPMLEKV